LREIIQKLDKSANSAKKKGLEVTACVLVTNRPFTQSAEQLWEIEQNNPRGYELRHFSIPWRNWETALHDFGRKLCALDHNIEAGINSLIGRIVRETGEQNPIVCIEIEDIKQEIVGTRRVRQLTLPNAKQWSSRELDNIEIRLGLTGSPVYRELLMRELGRISNERAIIVLHGKGGCGKTVSLWQWVRESNRFVAFSTMREIPRSWITYVMCEWLNLPQGHPWRRDIDFEDAINRIARANPDLGPPLVHFALDGLDELISTHEMAEIIRETVRWFWDEDRALMEENRLPRAILVVSCRIIDDFIRWLPPDLSGSEQKIEVEHILINEFSDTELVKALKISTLNTEIRERIEQSLHLKDTVKARIDTTSIIGTSIYQSQHVDRSVIDAIHHPVVWGVFLQLDSSVQENLLNGDRGAFMQLAHLVVGRFCRKVILRRRIANVNEELLLAVLKDIERFYEGDRNFWRQYTRDWSRPTFEQGLLDRIAAGSLYNEALSYGLIIENSPRTWQWSYTWIRDYLISEFE